MSGAEDPEDADEPTVVPLNGELDLHAFAPRDIPSVVADYVDACRAKGVLDLRLVHGRGRGVQRAVVRRLLSMHPGVAEFHDAPPHSGGWGATLARLRPSGERAQGAGYDDRERR